MRTGMLFTFEGIDGSGKTTQRSRIVGRLRQYFPTIEIVETWEPGSTDIGVKLRRLILDKQNFREGDPDPITLAYMMLADRAEHVTKIVAPALKRGALVISDRFAESTLAYQGYGAGISLGILHDAMQEIMRKAGMSGVFPRCTIYFDIDPEVAKSRITKNERWDDADGDFRKRILDGYRKIIRDSTTPVISIDANLTIPEVTQQILGAIVPHVESHYGADRRFS